MKVRVREIRLSLEEDESRLPLLIASRLEINVRHIKHWKLVRKAVDARRRSIYFSYTIDIELAEGITIASQLLTQPGISLLEDQPTAQLMSGSNRLAVAPLIVGAGPAGLFAALLLARHGYRPIVIEQGQDVDQRVQAVERFWSGGVLDRCSNTQFGEGGAGTFSDGKLTTRIGDQRVDYVLRTFAEFGADPEIMYVKKPHVGTDRIRQVVKNIRREVIRLGGEFYFSARMTDILVEQKQLKSIIINNEAEISCEVLVLAVGNSAREVYHLLHRKGVSLIPKAFALGVRVEHPQHLIDRIQYGQYAGHPRLPVADYQLTYQDRPTGRSLYTFCMCPGGRVIASSSAPGEVVVNGMSYFSRDSGLANSAMVVTVHPEDWENDPLGGVHLQQQLEQKAYAMGGENYHAPAQYLHDFMAYQASGNLNNSMASYRPGVTGVNLWQLLPQEIAEVMRRGLLHWDKKAPGFISEEAVMTGVETRTSAPLRIERDQTMNAVSMEGIYPCGEGAGYAGGIVSAAVDGLKVAEKIISQYERPNFMPLINNHQVQRGSQLPNEERNTLPNT
ncbi:MAG TPA: NAD(P)-binding protein [Syntrophomonas sp.]|nr:NAD(P)-binding protein [Syntrophomonas sp.]